MFYKKRFLKNFLKFREDTSAWGFLIKFGVYAQNFIEKETMAQVFSCEFCESFNNK